MSTEKLITLPKRKHGRPLLGATVRDTLSSKVDKSTTSYLKTAVANGVAPSVGQVIDELVKRDKESTDPLVK